MAAPFRFREGQHVCSFCLCSLWASAGEDHCTICGAPFGEQGHTVHLDYIEVTNLDSPVGEWLEMVELRPPG